MNEAAAYARAVIADERKDLVPGQVRVVVEKTDREGDVLTTVVRPIEGRVPLGDELGGPASLLWSEVGADITLHRGRRQGDGRLAFLTFGDADPPPVGSELVVQWWWIPGTQEMLEETSEWRPTVVTAHWYCPLTYESLDEGDDAYINDDGTSISVRGWQEFVRDDRLRLKTVRW